MYKKLNLLLITVSIFLSMSCFAANTPKYNNLQRNTAIMNLIKKTGTEYVSDQSILWVQEDYLTPSQALDLQKKINKGITKIENYLGVKLNAKIYKSNKITYYVESTQEASHSITGYAPQKYLKPIIFLTWAKNNRSSYLHETVHIIAWNWSSVWIKEGLAVYLNDKLGGSPTFPNFGQNIDSLAKQNLYHKNLLNNVGQNGIVKFKGIRQKKIFYILSGSFVKYLFNALGNKIFMHVYDSKNTGLAIKQITGRNIENWKESWIKHITS